MKFLRCMLSNFGSYKELDLDLSNLGLSLVYGKTGSGKSTIPDGPAWVLFGVTAKNGSVDDIRSWQAEGEPTTGNLEVQTPTGDIMVTRTRGTSKHNDLYWVEAGTDKPIRGKDMADTQRLLEERLGVTADLFLIAAYFHEFSSTGRFFQAKAKERRELFEALANLDLPVKVANATSEGRKTAKGMVRDSETALATEQGKQAQLLKQFEDSQRRAEQWEIERNKELRVRETLSQSFETDKTAKIEKLKESTYRWARKRNDRQAELKQEIDATQVFISESPSKEEIETELLSLKKEKLRLEALKCKACGGPTSSMDRDAVVDKINDAKARMTSLQEATAEIATLMATSDELEEQLCPYSGQLQEAMAATNIHAARLEQLKTEVNPYLEQIATSGYDHMKSEQAMQWLRLELDSSNEMVSHLNRLYDLSFEFRGVLLRNAVKKIQDSTNGYLEKYFDAELRVAFTLSGSDDLQVSIQKSGYDCVYQQLSKGQRQLLKLCFSLSVMQAAADKAGIHFENLFFDEALDGLDADLKVKAFSLFTELATQHESVIVIEHLPQFQDLFASKFYVTMDADTSSIQAEHE